jgi:hypothetical protein
MEMAEKLMLVLAPMREVKSLTWEDKLECMDRKEGAAGCVEPRDIPPWYQESYFMTFTIQSVKLGVGAT